MNNHKIILEDEEENEYMAEIDVGPEDEFKTIQSAVDAAGPKTRIKVKKGIYKENIKIIDKNDIEICSETPLDPAIILSDNMPCIKICGMAEQNVIKLSNLRMIHRGIREDLQFFLVEDELTEKFARRKSIAAFTNLSKENNFIYQHATQNSHKFP